MSDIRLFRLISGRAVELQGEASDLEKPLQALIEANLEPLLGIRCLDAFPDSATYRVGMGDLSIRQEWESCCHRSPTSYVWVWTLDGDLAGLDQPPRRR